ncbi:hypothetical protein NECID01_0445 [Nematocida sp. AWRm77]|nr:hypothetical protein NECID01_0445 [Nematocida sp. AWRm77]
MLHQESKRKEEETSLIKNLCENHRKRQSVNLYIDSALSSRAHLHTESAAVHVHPEARENRGVFIKAWKALRSLWLRK